MTFIPQNTVKSCLKACDKEKVDSGLCSCASNFKEKPRASILDIIDDLYFRENNTIWFDYIDFIKANKEVYRKGLKYTSGNGRYYFYIVSEEGEEILLDALQKDDTQKMWNILKMFQQ